MQAIPVFEKDTIDFTTNGLGLLFPKECVVSEIANGLYEAELVQPIHEDGKFELLKRDRILRLPVPVRESPLYAGNTDETKTVQRAVYKVRTSGLRLRLRTAPDFDSATIGYYSSGTEVIEIGDPSGNWLNVTVRNGGATGWMHSDNLEYVTTITDVIGSGTPGQFVQVQPTREQLFRIYNVETNTETKLVTVKAFHIFYDLRGNVINVDLTTKGVDAAEAAHNAFDNLLNPTNFRLYTLNLSGRGIVKGQYSYMGIIEAMLDPDNGMVPKANAYLIRDNWDIFMIPPVERDLGVTIRRRKNLVGVTVTDDFSSVVTRIIPVGKDQNGKNLKLNAEGYTIYVNSPHHLNDYATIYAQKIDYDVTEVKTQAEADPNDGKYYGLTGENGCYNALINHAMQDFADGIDLPSYRMDVNFLLLGNTEEYAEFANLQSVHMFDTITVIDELIGITSKLRVTGYEWDAVNEQYISVTLGDISKVERTVYGYNIESGSIVGQKIVENAITVEKIANNAVMNDKIASGAITADKIATGTITADSAIIAAGAIGTAQIQDAAITDAKIGNITANKITSGTLDASLITVRNLNAESITTGLLNGQVVPVLGTDKIADSAITVVKLASDVGTDLDISGNNTILLQSDNLNNIAAQMLLMSESISTLVSDTSEQGAAFTTSVTQTANELRAVVTSVAELQALNEQTADSIAQLQQFQQTYFSAKDNGLEIGKAGNPFTFRVDNDDLGFYYNGTLLSYMRGDVMYIEKANVGKSLQIGTYYSIEETGNLANNRRLGFYYLG